MKLEQLTFCMDATRRGDLLYVGVKEDYRDNVASDLKRIDHWDIEDIQKLLDNPPKSKKYLPVGFFTELREVDEELILLRKHRNKYYDMYGERWYPY